MCGIAGIIDRAVISPELLERFSSSLSHRGPDDRGFLLWDGQSLPRRGRQPAELGTGTLALVHRRLSILDLSESGWQPMSSPDQRYHVVFNGEIYNYLELRAELETLGHRFCSTSDTEVLIAAYASWGAEAIKRFVGMFAFALLDTHRRVLFIARDFFGIKPFYYSTWSGGVAFSSEVKTLLGIPAVGRRINAKRAFEYLRFGMTDYASETLFQDVFQLPAAHYAEIPLDNPQNFQPQRYWDVALGETIDISFEEAASRTRELFLENIQLHLRSDVPVGAALSGGIDSSAIVMAIRALEPQQEIHAFSFIADDPAISEERWVDTIVASTRAVSHKVTPVPGDLATDLEHLMAHQDEPFGSTTIYAQYRVFQLAHEAGIKVMLDGQGADEVLGGYRSYLAARLATLVKRGRLAEAKAFVGQASRLPNASARSMALQAGALLVPQSWHAGLRRLAGRDLYPEWVDARWLSEREVRPHRMFDDYQGDVLRGLLRHTLMETSLPSLLRYEDRNSMAHSIESRVPFLTPAFVSFVLSLPENFIIGPDGTTKRVFRAAMRGLVPDAILDRKDKIGFNTPERQWLTAMRPWVEGVLDSEAASRVAILDRGAVKEEWRRVLAGEASFDTHVWRWINLIRWTDRVQAEF